MLKFNSFSASYAGVSESGFKIDIKAILEVTVSPVAMTRQVQWCDGNVVEDSTGNPPPPQPVGILPPLVFSRYVSALPFSLTGHIYKMRIYYDTSYVEAETRFLTPTEIMLLAGIGIGAFALIVVAVASRKKK